jgi:hypothetical protein
VFSSPCSPTTLSTTPSGGAQKPLDTMVGSPPTASTSPPPAVTLLGALELLRQPLGHPAEVQVLEQLLELVDRAAHRRHLRSWGRPRAGVGSGSWRCRARACARGGSMVRRCTLDAVAFLGRFLQQVLPQGFSKVRHYGLFSPSRHDLLAQAREQLIAASANPAITGQSTDRAGSYRRHGDLSPIAVSGLRHRRAAPGRDPAARRSLAMMRRRRSSNSSRRRRGARPATSASKARRLPSARSDTALRGALHRRHIAGAPTSLLGSSPIGSPNRLEFPSVRPPKSDRVQHRLLPRLRAAKALNRYAVRRDGRRVSRRRMTPARARSASFASRAPRKTAATSGSRVTTIVPLAYRVAYLFGRERLKSYSGSTGLAPVS